jgi:hypothetical protein
MIINSNYLSNLPSIPKPNQGTVDSTAQNFSNQYQFPLQLSPGTFNTVKGFFASKGFDPVAAESISVVIIRQALQDNINPIVALDGLSKFNGAQLTELVTQILNYNRFKSSFLGIGSKPTPNSLIQRNILA